MRNIATIILCALLFSAGCKPEKKYRSLSIETIMIIYTSGYYEGLSNRERSDSIRLADSVEYAEFLIRSGIYDRPNPQLTK